MSTYFSILLCAPLNDHISQFIIYSAYYSNRILNVLIVSMRNVIMNNNGLKIIMEHLIRSPDQSTTKFVLGVFAGLSASGISVLLVKNHSE